MKTITSTTHRDTEYRNLIDVNEYQKDQFAITFLSTFTGASKPNEPRKTFQLFLNKEELKNLKDILNENIA